MSEQTGEFAKGLSGAAREMQAADGVEETLRVIVELCVRLVEGCDHAGVLLAHKARRVTAAAGTDEVVERSAQLQSETGEGPSVDAIREHEVFESGDVAQEGHRWPTWAPAAVELGIRSVLGFRLFVAEYTLGSLDLYSDRTDAFDVAAREKGQVIAAHAAIALSAAQTQEQLEQAVESRDVIGQAKGILMERQHIGADAAFDVLRRASQRGNSKLRDVAQQVANSAEGDEPSQSNGRSGGAVGGSNRSNPTDPG